MREPRLIQKTYLFFAVCSLLLFSCQEPYIALDASHGASHGAPQFIPAGKGSITLVVDEAGGRTILPESGLGKFAAYTILFYESGTVNVLETENRTSSNLDEPFYLIPGTYDIKVTAYTDDERTKAAARGSLSGIEINVGGNVTQVITLNPIFTPDSEGKFSWEITVPAGLSSASMTITPVDPDTGTSAETISFTGTTFTDSLTLKTGYYYILIKLKKTDTQEISFREFLHVYDNLESFFSRVFTDDHFNNIKYTITYVFDNDTTTPLQNDCLHGGKATNHQPAEKKPTPAGLYLGAPPESQTFAGWYANGVPWDFDNPVTSDMTLTAQWTAPGLVESVAENDVAAAVTYINANLGAYTLLMGGDATVSTAISLTGNAALTIKGLSAVKTITLSGGFTAANTAALTIGENITFAGSGELIIDSGASITLSGNAAIGKLTLNAASAGSNSSVSIVSGWTGGVTTLNLKGNSAEMGTVISYWVGKTVLQGSVTAATVGRFTTVYFINNTSAAQLITTANPPTASGGYRISTDTGDIGKLVAINNAARVVSLNKEYPTLYAAITDSDLPSGTATDPTEIVILKDITAPETGTAMTGGYTIPGNKHIKLTVEAGKDRTITASPGDFRLFSVSNAGSSLTLEGNGTGTLTLSGGGADAESNRNGVYVNGSGRSFTMNNDVTITGFYINSSGGGVYVSSGTFTMNGGNITDNKVMQNTGYGGGGVYSSGTFTMNGGTIYNNTTVAAGGGVLVNGGTFIMNNNAKIESNNADSGGGVYLVYYGKLTMNGGEISGNSAASGGGVSVSGAGSTFTMIGGEISGNSTSLGGGGGVYVSNASFILKGGTIKDNKANSTGSSYGGGGVYVFTNSGDYSASFIMDGGEIMNNTATNRGGGVYITQGGTTTFTMSGGKIYGTNEEDTDLWNKAPNGGAAFYLNSGTAQYGDSYSIYGTNITTTNDTLPPPLVFDATFTSIADMKAWLDGKSSNTISDPYLIALNVGTLGGSYGTSGSAGNALFVNNDKYVSLILSGNNLASIDDYAFQYCTNLTSVTIPNSVIRIGYCAFFECRNLTRVTIPNSVTSIGDQAFAACTSLTGVTIPNSVTSIGDYTFQGCTGLTSITIPSGVTKIGYSAFEGCTKLTGITIPSGVTSIEGRTFINCTSLTSIIIPNNVKSIGYQAFYGCTSLADVTIGSGVTSIDTYAFHSCTSLTSITIPNSVTEIGSSAFQNCTKLISVTIGNGVTRIGDQAFNGCPKLTSVTFETGSNIANTNFGTSVFPQGIYGTGNDNLKNAYLAAPVKAGLYTRETEGTTWTRQP